jgi:hypothetical protein
MANLKISQLTAGNPAQSGDLIPIDRSGSNFAVSASSIAQLAEGALVYNVMSYGAVGNGSTDDSAAVIAAIAAAYAANGGIVFFPEGKYLINSQIVMPNTGGSSPLQPSIRLTGAGPGMATSAIAAGTIPLGGAMLDLRNNAVTAKIQTIGAGYLEIDHLTLIDGGSDSAAFVYTTNTVLHIHDVAFYGTAPASTGVSAVNDAIILGGTTAAAGGAVGDAFQGYGTVIRDNYFNQIKRVVLGQAYCNAVQIYNNTVWGGCGYSTGGAFELATTSSGTCTGNLFTGNLIELAFYKYGFHEVSNCIQTSYMGNNMYDAEAGTVACYRFETTCEYALVVAGYSPSGVPIVSDVDVTATLISAADALGCVFTQPETHLGGDNVIYLNPATGNVNIFNPMWKNGDGNYFDVDATPSATFPVWILRYVPVSSGTPQSLISVSSLTSAEVNWATSAASGLFIDNVGGDLHLRAFAGGVLWLGSAGNLYVAESGVIHSSVSTGTAPLVISSTTNVANLNASSLNGATFAAPGAIGGTTPAPTLGVTEILMNASTGAPTSSGTAGTAGEIIYFGGVLYFCSVTGVAGSATWNNINLTAV